MNSHIFIQPLLQLFSTPWALILIFMVAPVAMADIEAAIAKTEAKLRILHILSQSKLEQPAPSKINLHQLIVTVAQHHHISSAELATIVFIESSGNPCAVSAKGAKGLGQIMDATASMLGINDPFQAQQNLNGTAKYYAQQLTVAKGNKIRAVAAYNHGPRAIKKSYRKWPTETKHYVRKFKLYLKKFSSSDWQQHLPEFIAITNHEVCVADG